MVGSAEKSFRNRRTRGPTRPHIVAQDERRAIALQLARATPDRAESDAILEAGVRAALRLAK